MSFASPAVISINSVNKSLNRVNGPVNGASEYHLRSATDDYFLSIRNTKRVDKKTGVTISRHNAELVHTVFPVAPAVNSTVRKTYLVIENQEGDTLTDPTYVAAGLFNFMTATSNANIALLMNDES